MKLSSKGNNRKDIHKIIICHPFLMDFAGLFTKEENRTKTFKAILIFLSSCLAANIFYCGILLYMPYSTAEAYVKCLNCKDYDKALEYYIDVPDSEFINNASICASLENEYGSASKISIKSVSRSSKPKIYDAKVAITKDSKKYTRCFSLYNTKTSLGGLKREWRVLFPLKVQDVTISGPDGSSVCVDGISAGTIQNGTLDIKKAISGDHEFKAMIPGMAISKTLNYEINEINNNIALELIPEEGFRRDMENLILNFCKGWSKYCLTRKSETMQDYLTSELFNQYMNDPDMFYGSKYEECQYAVDFKEMSIESRDRISLRADEKWHLKEVIVIPGLVFETNNKTKLEQNQYISWNYHIIRESGSWKIDSVDQIEFRQEIIE